LIAVLPLRNLNGQPAKESFADALTDEFISALGHLSPERLRVIAFTSVAHYKQSTKTILQIGKELGVDYVMEGGVRWYGRRVRVTARLIAASDQAQVWADSFEIQLPALFSLQQGLARQLAGALSAKLRLTPSGMPRPDTCHNCAAHDAYLAGIAHLGWGEADIKKSSEDFSRAIELDTGCAAAHAELALAYYRLGLLYDYPPVVTWGMTKELALKALELDPGLARAHAALGTYNLFSAWNWSAADASSGRAISLNPSDKTARVIRAAYCLVVRKLDEAAEHLREAQRLDLQSPGIGTAMAIFGYFAGRYDMALERFQRIVTRDPSSALAHLGLGLCFAQKGEYKRALVNCQKARKLSPGQILYAATLCDVYARAGQRKPAERLLQDLVDAGKQQYMRYIHLASASVGLVDTGQTLDWLEEAYEQRDPLLVFLKADPSFEPLSRSARFRSLLGRIGLPN
jgi:TolB-like protein/Tfp pilus assembly protein PilF